MSDQIALSLKNFRMCFSPPCRHASTPQIAAMIGSGPKAAHQRAELGSNSAIN